MVDGGEVGVRKQFVLFVENSGCLGSVVLLSAVVDESGNGAGRDLEELGDFLAGETVDGL